MPDTANKLSMINFKLSNFLGFQNVDNGLWPVCNTSQGRCGGSTIEKNRVWRVGSMCACVHAQAVREQ